MSSEYSENKSRRYHELDSMRGLAAMIVVFCHFRNMFYHSSTFRTGWESIALYPLVAGHESVVFFFLLSGFVLSLPFLKGKDQPYSVFLLRRVLRIYGPYLGALALSITGCAIWHGRIDNPTWASPVTLRNVLEHVLFIGNYDYFRYNTAFWSLVYEMRISIVFPALFILTNKIKLRYALFLIIILTGLGVRSDPSPTLATFQQAAIFMFGILFAKNLHRISKTYSSLTTKSKAVLACVSFGLYISGPAVSGTGFLWHFGDVSIAVGVCGLIAIGLYSSLASKFLTSRFPLFLGKISYSLYLVHGTVLFAMAVMFQAKINHIEFFLIYLPVAILLSWVFYLGVEKPFMTMSKRVGKSSNLSSLQSEITLVG